MLQGFNTGNAWGNFINAQGQGHKSLQSGIESLGKAVQLRRKNTYAQNLKEEKEAKKARNNAVKGKFADAVNRDDQPAMKKLMAENSFLLESGFVKSVQEANSYGQPEEMSPYQKASLDIEDEKLNLRHLENKQRALDRKLAKETNILKKKQLEQQIADNEIKRKQLELSVSQDDLKLKNAIKLAEEEGLEKSQKVQTGFFDLANKIDSVDALLNNDAYIDNLEGYSGILPTITTTGREAEAYFNNIKDSLTLENLSKMSGTLTDKDINVLSSAASALQVGMGGEKMKRELRRIRTVLNRRKVNYQNKAGGLDKIIIFEDHPVSGMTTEEDIQDTMKAKNLTRRQIMDILNDSY